MMLWLTDLWANATTWAPAFTASYMSLVWLLIKAPGTDGCPLCVNKEDDLRRRAGIQALCYPPLVPSRLSAAQAAHLHPTAVEVSVLAVWLSELRTGVNDGLVVNEESNAGPNVECSGQCWVHVDWTACGTADYERPGCAPGFLNVQCCLLPSLSLSVSAWCQTEPYFGEWGQGVSGGGRERGGEGDVIAMNTDSWQTFKAIQTCPK